jgi:antitoxin (DNA-binding transcriptional repressor) of toxin-antitoxin stability system
MQVSISQFRRDMFALVNRAIHGEQVSVMHKGQRIRLVPESPGSRLDRITPLQIINPEPDGIENTNLLEEMEQAWERDWADL